MFRARLAARDGHDSFHNMLWLKKMFLTEIDESPHIVTVYSSLSRTRKAEVVEHPGPSYRKPQMAPEGLRNGIVYKRDSAALRPICQVFRG